MANRLMSFSRLLDLPENHSALVAVQDLAAKLGCDREAPQPNPLYLYGRAGSGKTCLSKALQVEVLRHRGQAVIGWLSAKELESLFIPNESTDGGPGLIDEVDLLIVEDLHQLPLRWADPFVGVIDSLQARQVPLVFTALMGPGFLPFSGRLTSRLLAGLVVGLEPLQAPSRLSFLQAKAQERQLAVRSDVLTWLADRMRGSCRELEGVVIRLEALCRLHRQPVDVAAVARHFNDELEANKPSIDRIMQRVSEYFQIPIGQLFSDRRDRRVLIPRQISMYLARRLTSLSFEEIGDRFGGRDHSTVLHGCRKITQALSRDTALAGVVHQLQAALP
jgi:chromosomal replication initiator protein